MRKLLKWIFIIFIGLIVLGLILGNGADEQATTDSDVAVSPSEQGVASEPQGVVDVAEVGGLTRPQKNAVRSAEQYISMSGFSRDGLIEQLSSEHGNKYSVSEATYGAQQAGACS